MYEITRFRAIAGVDEALHQVSGGIAVDGMMRREVGRLQLLRPRPAKQVHAVAMRRQRHRLEDHQIAEQDRVELHAEGELGDGRHIDARRARPFRLLQLGNDVALDHVSPFHVELEGRVHRHHQRRVPPFRLGKALAYR